MIEIIRLVGRPLVLVSPLLDSQSVTTKIKFAHSLMADYWLAEKMQDF